MNNNEKVDTTKHEKIKLHMKYIIAISAIISLGSVVLSLYCQDAFVAQVSFAATITSIVLSVIAIWMSISSEHSTSDIRVKIAESTERLSGTTKEMEAFNNNYKETMDKQLAELKNIQEQLAKITHSVNTVQKQVSFISEKSIINPNNIDNSVMTTSQRVELFNNIYSWETVNDPLRELIFCKMAGLLINGHINHNSLNINDIINYFAQSGFNMYICSSTINACWGIINTLTAATVFDDTNAVSQILNIITNKLYPNLQI